MTTLIYREHSPPPALTRWVECIWTVDAPEGIDAWPVRPDGCMDLVQTDSGPLVVGAMTRQETYSMPAGARSSGIRFRPGMARSVLGIAAHELTDLAIPLREVLRALPEEPVPVTPVQRAIEALTHSRGTANLDWLANQANLSPRQFRRRCLEESGLSPKHLARILRFRHACARAASSAKPDWANIAADCGYFDQAHLIRDFQEFTGKSPVAVFSNPLSRISSTMDGYEDHTRTNRQ